MTSPTEHDPSFNKDVLLKQSIHNNILKHDQQHACSIHCHLHGHTQVYLHINDLGSKTLQLVILRISISVHTK